MTNMTIEQFLNQFKFKSLAECRRTVASGAVVIDNYKLNSSDLLRSANELVHIGSSLSIGKHHKFIIEERHLQ